MSLQIRRGTDLQRTTGNGGTGIIFDDGEIVWSSDTKKLYIGDGITAGGNNILANAAGTGLTFDPVTQTLALNGSGLGLTTSVVTEGTNLYYTDVRAKNAAASIFTSSGSPTVTGTVTGTVAGTPSQITLSSTTGLVAGESITITGTGSGLFTPGVYYIYSVVDSTHITLCSSRANYLAGTTISGYATASVTGTSFSAGGGDTQITFTYNAVTQSMSANVTVNGLVKADPAPQLGANLDLNSYTIQGTGAINVTGNVAGTSISTTGTGTFATMTATNANVTTGLTFSAGAQINGPLKYRNSVTGLYYTDAPGNRTTIYASAVGYSSGENINVSRGTTTSPTVVTIGDKLEAKAVLAYDGTSYVISSAISQGVDANNGAISTGVIPGTIGFTVFNDGNGTNLNKTLFMDSRGYVGILNGFTKPAATLDVNGFMKLAVLTAAPASPTNGMIAIADGTSWNPAGTGKSVMVVYLGGGWRVSATAP